jgi:hypothetical protein
MTVLALPPSIAAILSPCTQIRPLRCTFSKMRANVPRICISIFWRRATALPSKRQASLSKPERRVVQGLLPIHDLSACMKLMQTPSANCASSKPDNLATLMSSPHRNLQGRHTLAEGTRVQRHWWVLSAIDAALALVRSIRKDPPLAHASELCELTQFRRQCRHCFVRGERLLPTVDLRRGCF